MSNVNLQEQFITPPKIARLLKTSVDQVHGWISSGELKAINLSNGNRPRWKIRPSDLETFLETRSNRTNRSEAPKVKRLLPVPKKEWV